MVRLGDNPSGKAQEYSYISIPLWFDWEAVTERNRIFLSLFQFHYGSIGRAYERGFKYAVINFNSTMVRLGGYYPGLIVRTAKYFNSTMVRLGVYCRRSQDSNHCNFNSTMVRLGDTRRFFNEFGGLISIPLWFDWEFNVTP